MRPRRAETGPGLSGGDSNQRNTVRIHISAGRKLDMGPADVVGAIANYAQVSARGIRDIEIGDTLSLAELPDADCVVNALRGATLGGRMVTVRRDDGRRKTLLKCQRLQAALVTPTPPGLRVTQGFSQSHSKPARVAKRARPPPA